MDTSSDAEHRSLRILIPHIESISDEEFISRPDYPGRVFRGAGLAGVAVVMAFGAEILVRLDEHYHFAEPLRQTLTDSLYRFWELFPLH